MENNNKPLQSTKKTVKRKTTTKKPCRECETRRKIEGKPSKSAYNIIPFVDLIPLMCGIRYDLGLTFTQLVCLSLLIRMGSCSLYTLCISFYCRYTPTVKRSCEYTLRRLMDRGLVDRVSPGVYAVSNKGLRLLSGQD